MTCTSPAGVRPIRRLRHKAARIADVTIVKGRLSSMTRTDKPITRPLLARLPAAGWLVSAEPSLETVDLGSWLGSDRIAWVIVGGESRKQYRPSIPIGRACC
jgi:protein gp37